MDRMTYRTLVFKLFLLRQLLRVTKVLVTMGVWIFIKVFEANRKGEARRDDLQE